MNWNALKWGYLEAAWALGLLLALGLFVWYRNYRTQRELQALQAGQAFEDMVRSRSAKRRKAQLICLIAGTALVVTSLMQPRYGMKNTEVTDTGIDIAIVLDVSKSMKVRDVVPDRLEAAKGEISGLLKQMRGGRVALVPFAGIPFVQCPLTNDFEVIRAYLRDLRVEDMPVGGTNLGRALQMAERVLMADEAEGTEAVTQFKGSNHKAIVLFTDGENHEGTPVEVASKFRENAIRIFTIGVGSASGNPVPILTEEGTVSGYLKDEEGKPIVSSLDQVLLQKIAEETSGSYHHYADRSIAKPLFKALSQLEQAEYDERYLKRSEERFQWTLLPAFLLLLMGAWLPSRTRKLNTTLLLLLSVATMGLPTLAEAQSNEPAYDWTYMEDPDIERGNRALLEGLPLEAIDAYAEAAKHLPETPELNFNRGLAMLANGDGQGAVEMFTRALSQAQGKTIGEHHLALGLAYAKQAQTLESSEEPDLTEAATLWGQAIREFESSLAHSDTKTVPAWNLELALIGECRTQNDPFEPNNEPGAAHKIELAENPETQLMEGAASFSLCLGDTDWAAVSINPGEKVEISVKHSGDGESDTAKVEIYLGGDKEPVEQLTWGKEDSRDTWKFHNQADGQLALLQISAGDGEAHQVDVDVVVRPPCAIREDQAEQNDTLFTAVPPPSADVSLHICENDPDWFYVDVAEGESLFAVASAEGEWTEGFSLAITDATGRELTSSATHKSTKMALLLDPLPGRYFARVQGGVDIDAPYTLLIHHVPPCPEGNDPLEPNNTADEAKSLAALQTAPTGSSNAPFPMAPPGTFPPTPMPGVPGAVPAPPGQQIPNYPPGPQAGLPPLSAGPSPAPAAPGQAGEAPTTALLRICDGDEDYIRVTVPADTSSIATILFDHRKGDLKLTLFNEEGTEVIDSSDTSSSELHAESLRLPKDKENEHNYLLKIEGNGNAENFYLLKIDSPQGQPSDDGESGDNDDQEDNEQEDNEDEQEQNQNEDEQEEEKNEPPPEQEDPMSQALEQMDQNPVNLEAEEAKRNSPLMGLVPSKDW